MDTILCSIFSINCRMLRTCSYIGTRVITQRNLFEILLKQTEIRLYLPSSEWFRTRWTLSVRFQINRKMINIIRFRVDFSLCVYTIHELLLCLDTAMSIWTIRVDHASNSLNTVENISSQKKTHTLAILIAMIVNWHITTGIWTLTILVKISVKMRQITNSAISSLNVALSWQYILPQLPVQELLSKNYC